MSQILRDSPEACIVVFPECTTSNGRGILKFSPSLLTIPSKTKIFPVSLRYTPPDVTTPIPGTFFSFLWRLCSKPTHCIRVRIAEAVYNLQPSQGTSPPNASPRQTASKLKNSYEANFFDHLDLNDKVSSSETLVSRSSDGEGEGSLGASEKKLLDQVADDLARLGRVKRVGLGVEEKLNFVKLYTKRRR